MLQRLIRKILVFGQQLKCPGTHVFVFVCELRQGGWLRQAAGRVQRPKRAELMRGIGILREHFQQSLMDLWIGSALLQCPARMPHLPFILAFHHLDQRFIAQLFQIDRRGLCVAINDLEDPAIRAILSLRPVFVTLSFVIPVDQVHRTSLIGLQVDDLRPVVIEFDKVGTVMTDKAGALAFGHVHIDARAVDVVHENLAAIFFGPTAALINHQARMGVAATDRIGTAVRSMWPLTAGVMKMVGHGFDVVEDIRIEVLAALPFKTTALNHVPKMRNHARFDDTLAMLIKINPPRVARAFGKKLEDVPGWMIAPDAGSDRCALAIRRPRFADLRMREHTVAAVEPAVRPPAKSI